MKNLAIGAVLALGTALVQGCAGTPAPAGDPSAQEDPARRGLAEQPEDQIAGAVGRLGSEEESGGTYATMADMLRGRLPGVEIGETPTGQISVRIRGDQSILFNSDPLLVVDGVPVPAYSFSSTLRTMDPRTVESIRVLKDAGSTSSYGVRGAHGVILIRLKKG